MTANKLNVDPTAAVVAHGLLNALNVVSGSVALIEDSADPAEREWLATALERNLAFVADTVDDIADSAPPGLVADVHEAVEAGTDVARRCAGAAGTWRAELPALRTRLNAISGRLTNVVRGLPSEVIAFLDGLHGDDGRPELELV